MKPVECEFCTPEAARACTDPQCRARGYGHPPVSETTQQTLHNILRCIHSGTVARTQLPTGGGWLLHINDALIADEEIQLAVSVLEAQNLITWWPKYHPKQCAVLTLDNGMETLKDWDHRALLGGRHRLRLELVNDSCHDGGGGDEAA